MSYLDLIPVPVRDIVFTMAARERAEAMRAQLLHKMTYWRDVLNKEAGQRRKAHDHTPWGIWASLGWRHVGPWSQRPYTDQLFPFSLSKMSRRSDRKKRHPPRCVRKPGWSYYAR